MKKRKVYMYVFDTMSDWEVGYLTAELNTGRYFKKGLKPLKVITVGVDKNPIITMGGLKVLPEITIDELNIESNDLLILPGGNTWTSIGHEKILEKSKEALEQRSIVAAICGATLGLAKTGLLDFRNHTSNDLEFLKMVILSYSGEKYYKMESAVNDENLITASGIAPLEFTVQVLKVLDVFKEEALSSWLNLYKTHDSKYFFELMNCNK
ncbi:ThiJ/pfpI family protein [Clostridioides difficile]|uniref:DJ-1/PfpI domain-containing protein n=3 Tax=Clostridioides difficile TaxID=1496 RepID=A0A9R0BN05_CLODR|nr:type 1 glutamine amidotransferase family protein [Clostridioides difficile]OFU02758.1 glutamine amidotransferase [Clostridium sp. HMSC19E03]OFU15294.1 glutamine amidotransferase [Clostridium sp. HMSC19C08]OFU18320.1 glutamine amidotransferase [Clostridium sp. HMSC19C09]OFU19020.1 glutamine amidotransferase [Clostridium sp. HMSC19C05]OFU34160.1 glutamine amidotransferase [Clostridium sp. HMSC19B10]OFU40575.1 glutamine amidotransferase [Clostridium sp. HMSC19B01]